MGGFPERYEGLEVVDGWGVGLDNAVEAAIGQDGSSVDVGPSILGAASLRGPGTDGGSGRRNISIFDGPSSSPATWFSDARL